ncbi:cysteine hydrolase [Actinomycetospora chlora]|uniref:Cysteine hydrolase n=1 Tax=Actinomycetospora chlora TaxID=663608 RepID=A0ABP9C256_9PSEU
MAALEGKELVDDSIVFVVDMIKDFLDPGEEFVIDEGRSMYEGLASLLTFAREQRIPIVHSASQGMNNSLYEDHWWQIRERVSCQEGSPTVDVVDALRPAAYSDHEIYIPKSKYSPFYGTRLDTYLRNPPFLGRNTIIVTGMATNFCCFCTSSDAFNRDYRVLFVDDLNCTFPGIDGTPADVMHRITVETLKQGYVEEVVTARDVMARLTRAAEPALV